MSQLDKLINARVQGSPGFWFYDFELGGVQLGGGYFHRKADARRCMKVALRKRITDYHMIVEYLTLKFGEPS